MLETRPEIWGPVVAVIVLMVFIIGLCCIHQRDEIMPSVEFINYQQNKRRGQRRRPPRVSPAWQWNDAEIPRAPGLPRRPDQVYNPSYRDRPAPRGVGAAEGPPGGFPRSNRHRATLFAGRTGQVAFVEREVQGGRWQAVVLERQPGVHREPRPGAENTFC